MINTTDSCPTHENLIAYATGHLDDTFRENIDTHIDQCDECLSHLEEISSSPDYSFAAGKIQKATNLLDEIKSGTGYKEALAHSIKIFSQSSSDSTISLNKIFADFKLIREIGRGGMGVVYKAKQLSLKRIVALKVLPFSFLAGSNRKKRFHIESQAIAILQHPNIIPIYFSGEEKGNPYYVMPFIEGINLEQLMQSMQVPLDTELNSIEHYLKSSERFDQVCAETVSFFTADKPENKQTDDADNENSDNEKRDEADDSICLNTDQDFELNNKVQEEFKLNIETDYFQAIAHFGIQAANAIQYAHEMGVIHRDIKPSNIMINESGHLWLTDFGLARIDSYDGVTFTGDVMGTIRYMSPEQALGKQDLISNRTDIYSLGVTLYELVTLNPLFSGELKEQVIQNVIHDEPVSPGKINSQIPKDFETIILKATSKEIENRYTSAGEMEADLKRMLDSVPIHAKRPTLLDRMIKWSKRRKTAAAAIIFSVTAISFVSFVFMLIFSSKNMTLQKLNKNLQNLNEKYEFALKETRHAKDRSEQSGREAVKAFEEARLNNYVISMKLASEASEKNDSSRVLSMISPFEPKQGQKDIRGLEWFVLKDSSIKINKEVQLSKRPLYSVCHNLEKKMIAAAGAESKLFLLDLDTLEILKTISTEQIEINGLDFSKDGTLIASGGDDGTVRIFNTETGNVEHIVRVYNQIEGEKELKKVFTVQFTPDEKHLITSGNDNLFKMLNFSTGKLIGEFKGHKDSAEFFDISSDGEFLVTGGIDETVRLWQIKDQKEVKRIVIPKYQVNRPRATGVVFSKDQKSIAIGSKDQNIFLWNLADNKLSLIGHHDDPVQSLFFSNDEKEVIVTDRSGTMKIWSIYNDYDLKEESSPQPYHSQLLHEGKIYGGFICAKNHDILTVGDDGYLRGSHVNYYESYQGPINSVNEYSYSINDEKLAFYTHDKICLFKQDAHRLNSIWEIPRNNISSINLSENGKFIITGDTNGEIHLWNCEEKKHSTSWTVEKGKTITDVAISPGGNYLVYSINKDIIKVHELKDGYSRLLFPAITDENGLKGWKVKYLPFQERFVFQFENTINVWDCPTRKIVHQLTGHVGGISDYLVLDEGRKLLVSDENRSVHLWDIEKGIPSCSPWKHTSIIGAMALTSNEKTLITSDSEGDLTFWNYQQGQPLHTMKDQRYRSMTLLSSGMLLVQRDSQVNDLLKTVYFGDEWNQHFNNNIKVPHPQ